MKMSSAATPPRGRLLVGTDETIVGVSLQADVRQPSGVDDD